jgi:SnoaL-like domain
VTVAMTMDPHGPIPASDIETLTDRAAICELAKVYALGIDSRDEAMARSVFAPDAPMRGTLGEAPAHEYIPQLLAGVSNYDVTMHNITNQYTTVDGDEAEVWSYAVALHFAAPGTDQTDLTMGVQYRDRCSRTADGWLISGRETVKLWARGSLPQ